MINLLNPNNLGIISQFKLFNIIFMVIILILLLSMEILNKYSSDNIEYHKSGFFISKNLARVFGAIGVGSAFGSFLINRNKKEITEVCNYLTKQSSDLKREKFLLEDNQSNIITSALSKLDSINTSTMDMKKSLDKIKDILKNKNDNESITMEDINTYSELKYQISKLEVDWNTVSNLTQEFNKEISKNNFLPDNFSFDISNFYKDITNDQLGGIGLILFSQVLIGSAISIAFVFFGEYLIQRFNLENKYPKLAKFIQLRRKFQKYYLILNILYIVIVGIMLGVFGLWLYFFFFFFLIIK